MEEELNKIKQYLPRGYCRLLANEFNVSDMTVSNALRGKNKHFNIILGAIKIAKANKSIMNKLKDTAS
jgi:hypothetical protein